MMTQEQVLHIARHLQSHIEEARNGVLTKNVSYLEEVVEARLGLLEYAHDMVYVMREKQYKGYEDLDFSFDLSIDGIDLKTHEFHTLNYESFRVVTRIKTLLEFMEVRDITLLPEEANEQMNVLNEAIKDLSIGIMILKGYYNVSKDFDSIVI